MITPRIIFFSNRSENTLRFLNKLNLPSLRIPVSKNDDQLTVDNEFILLTPTYGGGNVKGSVPPAVVRFLNIEQNRNFCKGVITGGNTTFGYGYASAGDLIAAKIEVPHLYKFEVLGMPRDVKNVRNIIFDLFPDQLAYADAEPKAFAHPSAFR